MLDRILDEQKKSLLRKSHTDTVRHMLGRIGEKSIKHAKQETYFGETLVEATASTEGGAIKLVDQQLLSMRLYESRIASMQRAVAFFVMFHQMGKDVQVVTFACISCLARAWQASNLKT